MIKRALRSLLTLGGALLLVSATAGCLLGPPEDPENPGAEYEEEYYDDGEAEYGTESGALRVDRPAPVQQQNFNNPVREDDGGRINHGTPDPLNPVYMPTKPQKQSNSWSR